MKRNLSSQAIRAMAIGMAVTLGSATAVSGVVTGTVVNVYAASFPGFTATVAKESTNDLKITIGRESTNVFSLTGGQKLTNLEVKNGQKVVFSTESGGNGQINNITVSEKGNHEELYITIPSTEIKDGSLEGTEAKLTITKLKGNEIKYGQSSSENPLDFEGELNVTASGGAIGVDKTGPTLKSENIAYDDNNKTITIEASESLENFSEQANSGKFEFKSKPDANESDLEITNYSVVGNKLVLKLNKSLIDGEYIINYKVQDASNLKDAANNALKTGEVNFKLAETQKLVDSAKLSSDKSKITITFKSNVKNLVGTTENNKDEFKITGNSVSSVTVKDVAVQNTKELVLTLQGDLSNASDIKVGYTAKTNNKAVKVDNKVLLLENLEVTSDGQVSIAPIIQKGVIENNARNKIVLYFDSPVKVKDNNNKPRKDDFEFRINSSLENIIKDVEISTVANSIVTLNLTKDIKKDDNIKLKYKNTSGNHIVSEDGLKQVQDSVDNIKIENNIKDEVPPVESNITATTSAGTYTFKELTNTTVALTKFDVASSRQASDNKFENGVLTANGKVYTLTEIGVGTKVEGLTDTSLKGHTGNVITIKENAFSGNDSVKELSFPKVIKVEKNAFKGANALTSIDLGSTSKGLDVAIDAFTNATSLKTIATSTENKDKVDVAIKGSKVNAIALTEENYNKQDAKIAKDSFYQTKDGLIFKGLSDTELSFEGKDTFNAPTKPNGLDGTTQKTAYLVTYANGIVTLKAGETTPQPPATENFEVNNVNGKKLTFTTLSGKKEVALTGVGDATRGLESNILRDGVLTVNGNAYDFTQIGDGITSLGVNFKANEVLEGNLDKVTTVAKDAFKGNTTLTKISLPNVTTIAEGAFNGTTALTEVFLGDKEVTVGKNAFTGANSSIKVSSNNNKTLENLKKSETGLDTNKVENAAPFVKSAVVNDNEPNKVVVTFSEKVYAPINITPGDFTLEGEGKKLNATNVDGLKNSVDQATSTVTLTLDGNVKGGENRTLKFNKTGGGIKDVEDKELENIIGVKVTNNVIKVEAVEVTVTGATTNDNGKQLTINVEKDLADNQNLDKAGFVVSKESGNSDINVKSASVNGKVITLTLEDANPVKADHTGLKVEYNGSDLLQKDTNKPIKEFTTPFVVNKLDVTNPTLKDNEKTASTTENEKKYIITLPASEPIKLNGNNDEVKGAFTVTVVDGSKNVNSTSVAVGDDGKSLVLTVTTDKVLTPTTDKFKVVYNQDNERVKDLKDNKLATVTINDIVLKQAVGSSVFFSNSDSDIDLVATSLLKSAEVEVANGKVTVVNKFKGADQSVIQSMLTKDLTKIASGAFNSISGITLDLSNISVSVIDNGAFNGASNLTVKYTGSEKEAYELAKKLQNVSGVTLNNKKPSEVIKDYENNNNNGGSGGGSSSGGSGGGSGANIGAITNKKPNTEETTSQGNKNETVVENKQLSFDVIKLPSVEGEAKVFGDVSANHWAKSYIDKLSTARIINGSNGMFNPNGQTKRADVTVMLVNLLGLTPEANNKFADVNASAYYAPYVGTASTYGIVNGSNGMFNPQGVISRQDTMVMIAQILKGLNLNVNADTTSLSQFGDASKVSAYANESVAILVNSGIISGNNGKLNPTAPVTRAEMATIMSKLYDVLASANK